MDYFLLTMSTLCASGKALFCKVVGSAKGRDVLLANFKAFAVATAVAVLFTASQLPGIFSVSFFTLGLSAVFAASVFFTQLTQMKAMAEGPASLTTLIYSSAFLIPIVFGAMAWGEPISTVQYFGIAAMMLSLFLIVWEKNTGTINKRWLLFVALASLGSGANAILQKLHQFSQYKEELRYFLLFALFFSALFSLLGYLLFPKSKGSEAAETAHRHGSVQEKLYALSPIPLGICVGFLNFLNLMLAGRLPSVIHFPIYNVGSLILTGVISIIAFKERLSARKLIGCAIGVLAIVLIGMF